MSAIIGSVQQWRRLPLERKLYWILRAGLTTVIVIGLLVESVVFHTIETHTVRKWGMQR